jgi:uncharacterized Zn finger protein (UPF0148 family)
MQCERCGGRLFVDEPGELVCGACGERLYNREQLFAERLADVLNERTERELACELVREDPVLAERPRWDARKAPESYQRREREPAASRMVGVRLRPAEHAQLEQLAEQSGQSVSALARTVLRAYLATAETEADAA